MRAIRFHRIGSPDVLALEDAPDPTPGPGEILVRVAAAGVNYADVHFRKGEYFVKPKLPDIPGLEAAGVVEGVGAGVMGLAPGDRVALTGAHAYAEKMIAPAGKAYRLPEALSFEDGASLPVQGLTALLTLTRFARLAAGETVLVHAAAGGVGSLAVQLARRLGARLVIGTTGSEAKRPVLEALGVDLAVVGPDFVQAVRRAVPGGVDVILEMVGGTEAYKRNLACLAPFGRMVVYGAASGDVRGTVEPVGLMGKNLSVSGFYLTPLVDRPELCAPAFAELAGDVVAGRVRVLRDQTLPLAQAAEAHRRLESRASAGKVVLVP